MKRYMRYFLSVLIILVSLTAIATSAFAQSNQPRLGIGVTRLEASPLLLQHLRLAEGEGLMIGNVVAGSDLDVAGVSQGDILLAIDGHMLETPSDLQNYVASLPKGTQVTLDVIQKGDHRQIYTKLDNLPDEVVWKYAPTVEAPGHKGIGVHPNSQFRSQSFQIPGARGGSSAQQSVFHSQQITPSGIRSVTVTITGPSDDPDSEIKVEIGQDSYETHIGEINKLPDEAREAAETAIASRQSFPFGGGSSDMFEEMMMRQMEQMRQMDEMFNRSFGFPQNQQNNSTPQSAPQNNEKRTPVAPSANDIRS